MFLPVNAYCFWVLFFSLLIVRTAQRHQTGANSHSIYIHKHSKKPGIGPAQSIEIHAALRSCRPEGDNASKQTKERKKALLLILKYFAEKPPTIKLDFSQVPLTLSPVTGHRLGAIHYFLVWNTLTPVQLETSFRGDKITWI